MLEREALCRPRLARTGEEKRRFDLRNRLSALPFALIKSHQQTSLPLGSKRTFSFS